MSFVSILMQNNVTTLPWR